MKALILDAEKRTANVKDIPQPKPAGEEILIKVHSVALNPIDPLYVTHPLGATGRTLGSDFAGTVAALGENVPSSIKVGDRVAGFLQGTASANDRPGAFAEYLSTPWDLVWKLPEQTTFEDAAGVSLVALTAAQGVFHRLKLEAPFTWTNAPQSISQSSTSENDAINFFIYGASTSVALYAAQFVRLSAAVTGKKVVLLGAASKGRHAFLKGAPYYYDHLVDYRDTDWPEQIRALTYGRGVNFAYDCISEGDSVLKVSQTLAQGGKEAIVGSRAGGAWKADNLPVEPVYGAVWEGLGVEVQYQGFTVKASPEARDFAVHFYRWLSSGAKIQPNPIRLMRGGLDRIVEDGFVLLGPGMMEARDQSRTEEWMKPISAEKLVYKIAE